MIASKQAAAVEREEALKRDQAPKLREIDDKIAELNRDNERYGLRLRAADGQIVGEWQDVDLSGMSDEELKTFSKTLKHSLMLDNGMVNFSIPSPLRGIAADVTVFLSGDLADVPEEKLKSLAESMVVEHVAVQDGYWTMHIKEFIPS